MEEHPVEGTGGRQPDPPAMVDGALDEAAGDIALVEGVGNGDQAGNDGQLEAPAPAKPKSRYVHPICYDDTVVASLILSEPPMGEEPVYCMDEGPDCTVEGPAIQVEELVHPLPCLG